MTTQSPDSGMAASVNRFPSVARNTRLDFDHVRLSGHSGIVSIEGFQTK